MPQRQLKPENPETQRKLHEAKIADEQLRALYRQVFLSKEGFDVLRDLKEMFSGELVHSLEHFTLINVGSNRVIQHIEHMIRSPVDE